MTNQPVLVSTLYVLLLDVGLALLLLWSLRRLGATPRLIVGGAGVMTAWLALLGLVFGRQFLLPADIGGPAFYALLLGGVGVVAGVLLATPVGAAWRGADPAWLLLPQGVRAFFGAGFLMQGAWGTMPAGFAVLDGLLHVTAGVLALATAWLLQRGFVGRGGLWFTHLFGLLDIVTVATGIAFVLLREVGPYHNMMYAAFFAAPLFVGLHVVAVAQLLRAPAAAPLPVPAR